MEKRVKALLKKALDNREKILRSALSSYLPVYFIDNKLAEDCMKKRQEKNILLK